MYIQYDLIISLNFVIFLILPSQSDSVLPRYELVYDGLVESGWSHKDNADGTMEIIFECPQGLEEKHSSIIWQMTGLPSRKIVTSLTIKNCDLKLTVVPKYRNAELERFIIRNITELDIETSYVYSLVRMKYNVSVLVLEDIKNIDNFDTKSISGSFKTVRIQNCIIGQLHWNSIMISESTVFEFSNNRVKQSQFSFNLENVERVIFKGNEFLRIDDNLIMFVRHSYKYLELQFEDNVIQESNYTSMRFGLNNLESTAGISVKNNRFNCLQSKWLQLKEYDNKKELSANLKPKDFEEKFLLSNENNVCIDTPCQISVARFKRLYKFYGHNLELYCSDEEPTEPTIMIDYDSKDPRSFSPKNFDASDLLFLLSMILLILLSSP